MSLLSIWEFKVLAGLYTPNFLFNWCFHRSLCDTDLVIAVNWLLDGMWLYLDGVELPCILSFLLYLQVVSHYCFCTFLIVAQFALIPWWISHSFDGIEYLNISDFSCSFFLGMYWLLSFDLFDDSFFNWWIWIVWVLSDVLDWSHAWTLMFCYLETIREWTLVWEWPWDGLVSKLSIETHRVGVWWIRWILWGAHILHGRYYFVPFIGGLLLLSFFAVIEAERAGCHLSDLRSTCQLPGWVWVRSGSLCVVASLLLSEYILTLSRQIWIIIREIWVAWLSIHVISHLFHVIYDLWLYRWLQHHQHVGARVSCMRGLCAIILIEKNGFMISNSDLMSVKWLLIQKVISVQELMLT